MKADKIILDEVKKEKVKTDREIIDRIGIVKLKGDIFNHEISILRQVLPFRWGREFVPPYFKYKIKKQGWKQIPRTRAGLLSYLGKRFPAAWKVATDLKRKMEAIKKSEEDEELLVIDPVDSFIGKFKACVWLMGDDDIYEEIESLSKNGKVENQIAVLSFLNKVYDLKSAYEA